MYWNLKLFLLKQYLLYRQMANKTFASEHLAHEPDLDHSIYLFSTHMPMWSQG